MKARSAPTVVLPRIPKDIAPYDGNDIDGSTEILRVRCADIDGTGRSIAGLALDQVHAHRILLNRARLSSARLFDVHCEASDLSSSSWQRPRWQRVLFKGCKLTGAQVATLAGTDVMFQECTLEGTIFSGGKFKGVHFERCRMARVVFDRVELGNATFRRCDCTGMDLTGSVLQGVDLRGSEIPDIRVEVGQFKGLTIDPAQAAELVAHLGSSVRYLEEDDAPRDVTG